VRRFLLVALLLCSIGHAQQRVEVPNAEGWHALVLDSLTPRGEKELCTQKHADRVVTQVHRRRDALGALQWLAARPDVDAQRIPGCADALKARYRPAAPLLLLVGANDDWTAPQPCERLAQGHGGLVQIEVYPDAYHGFDGTAPVRLRADVPNGVNPGRGVHVGGDAAAAAASRQRLLSFLHEQLDGAAR